MSVSDYPLTPAALEKMKEAKWYYTIQLHDGSIVKGFYEDNLTLLPRLLQRRISLMGMRCLDIGPGDGLLPIVAKKGGASIAAIADYDARFVAEKLQYLQAIHQCELDINYIGRAHNVTKLLSKYPTGFDYINLSGVLYHVHSPLDVLAAARSLLRPNGLMIVSTITVLSDGYFMEFNNNGHLQNEPTTYWYISLPLLDYMLRLLCLLPIDVISWGTGNVSVLCRAADGPVARPDDPWMDSCATWGWELDDFREISAAAKLPRSEISLREGSEQEVMNLHDRIRHTGAVARARTHGDSHILMLDDVE
jgi:2-polyprenyl-3-methyl-5-hydroxy-6-metoxy-1,4-benzoquinol methylase